MPLNNNSNDKTVVHFFFIFLEKKKVFVNFFFHRMHFKLNHVWITLWDTSKINLQSGHCAGLKAYV